MALKQQSGLQAPDGSEYVTLTDGLGNLTGLSGLTPSGSTIVASSSGNVAAATATATLAGVAGKTTYLSGYLITNGGATVGAIVNGTITGLLGGTQTFNVTAATGITLGNTPISVSLNPPLPASAANTPIVVSVPSLGAGNTNSAVSAWGYQL